MPFKQLIFRFLIKAVSVNNKRFDKPEKFTIRAGKNLVLKKRATSKKWLFLYMEFIKNYFASTQKTRY
ncbi:hypothetical protein KADA111694_07210 [Kaistella daneshvariae]